LSIKAGSSDAERFIRTVLASRKIANFYMSHKDGMITRKHYLLMKASVLILQRVCRAHHQFVKCSKILNAKRDLWEAFRVVWGEVVEYVGSEHCPLQPTTTWSNIKIQYDMMASRDAEFEEQRQQERALQGAMDAAAATNSEMDVDCDTARDPLSTANTDEDDHSPLPSRDNTSSSLLQVSADNVELAQSAIKWLSTADTSYRMLFQQKIAQLTEGERSYGLSKRLRHAGTWPIFQTKLDKGVRILWTRLKRDSDHNILVCTFCNLFLNIF
jgi:hypothetical protein